MLTRCILCLIFCTVFLLRLTGQEVEDDVIYLNNGTFLRGKVIELNPEKSLKIVFPDNDTLEVQLSEVKKMTKEPLPVRPGFENGLKSWGYTNITEFACGVGYSEGIVRYPKTVVRQFTIQVSTLNGFTLTPYIQLGIGTGLELWRSRGFIPIYLDLRANLLRQAGTPFLYFQVGYAPGWIKGEPGMGLGGALAGLGAGARIRIEKLSMVLSLGYRFQQTRQWEENNNVKSKATLDANLFTIRAGVFF